MISSPPRLGVVACRVFEEELAAHGGNAAHIVKTQFLEIGLHDHPDGLRQNLASVIEILDRRDDIDAIALVYALCGCGTAGIQAGNHPIVIPRGHDCMTIFLGSKEAYAARQAAAPDTFYFTPGWMRAGRSPGPRRLEVLREELSTRFESDDVEYLLECEQAQWKQHNHAVFLDLGTPGAEINAREAADTAAALGWKMERPACDPSLLRDLLLGNWDEERFQVVPPGMVLKHQPDEKIFRVVPAATNSPRTDPQTKDLHSARVSMH